MKAQGHPVLPTLPKQRFLKYPEIFELETKNHALHAPSPLGKKEMCKDCFRPRQAPTFQSVLSEKNWVKSLQKSNEENTRI